MAEIKREISKNENGKYNLKVVKDLFYLDITYFCKDHIYGDMGFAFCDQADTRNEESLEDNISNMKYAIDEVYVDEECESRYEENGEIMCGELMKSRFEYEEDFFDTYEEAKEYEVPLWAMHECEDAEREVVYQVAYIKEEYGKKDGLEDYVGKVDTYIDDYLAE